VATNRGSIVQLISQVLTDYHGYDIFLKLLKMFKKQFFMIFKEKKDYSCSLGFLIVTQEPEELFETISQALLSSVDRDCLSGWGGHVYVV